MQFKTLLFAAVASVAVAQSTTTSAAASGSTCLAENILEACKATIQGQINACGQQDYSCLCNQYINMLQCYANCPGDQGVSSYQSLREQYCGFASVYSTSTSSAFSAPATSAATSTSASESAAQSGFGSGSGTASGATATSTGAAGMVAANGFVALAAAGFAALL